MSSSITPESYAPIMTRGAEEDLDATSIVDGTLRYTIDTGRIYLDIGNGVEGSRIRIGDIDDTYTAAEILALENPLPKLYIASDTGRGYVWVGSTCVDIGSVVLSAESADADNVIWFSGTTGKQPKYQGDLKYNPSSKTLKTTNVEVSNTLKVNGMYITVTENADNTRTTTFSFTAPS